MIDVHAHVLPFVDDGAKTIEESVELVRELYFNGVTDIICTPHFSRRFTSNREEILKSIDLLGTELKKQNLPVNLYYGREIYLRESLIEEITPFSEYTLNDTNYALIEFSFTDYTEITERVYELVRRGVKPIVAHFERYDYADIETAKEVKRAGGLISVNAGSLNLFNPKRRFAIKLLSYGLVDFITSDAHYGRKTCIKKAKNIVKRKLGKSGVQALFELNAKPIIKK
jgi:protein-tyrosine phosphatase